MEMKIKKTISILAVCMLVFVSLNAVMVYAPKPEDGPITPFQEVIIKNTYDEPVPVKVTNDPELRHTIFSANWESPIIPTGGLGFSPVWIQSTGYDKITLGASRSVPGLEWTAALSIEQIIGDGTEYPYGIGLPEEVILYDAESGPTSEIISFDIKGDMISILVTNPSSIPINAGELRIHYTMTTGDSNDLDEPIDVTLDEPIDVTLDETIEVTNPTGESLEVTIPEGVEVTNTIDANIDVSGWLHTTFQDAFHVPAIAEGSKATYEFDVEGYSEVTLYFSGGAPHNVNVDITMILRDQLFLWAYEKIDEFDFSIFTAHFSKTYTVRGPTLRVDISNPGPGGSSNIILGVYITT
ncbi:hypothetical protein ACFLRN_10705 [Thermoproteota archaeon]